MVKNKLRKSLLKQGLALSEDFIKPSSTDIQNKFIEFLDSQTIKNILLYCPFKQEIKLDQVIKNINKKSIKIYLPKVLPQKKLSFNLYTSESDLIKNKYGILESNNLHCVQVHEIDLLVIPFLGVDRHGRRLGYGGGYYDRALENIQTLKSVPLIVGIGYEYQLLKEIFGENHDIKYDLVITESNIHSYV